LYRRVIIALDVDSLDEAKRYIFPEALIYKVGWRLFANEGFKIFDFMDRAGKKVFLDLKLGDIPSTVEAALRRILRFKPYMTTLHAISGIETIKRAKQIRDEISMDTILLGVTLLTSLSDSEVREMGFSGGIKDTVKRLATLLEKAGADGLVCSTKELLLLQDVKLLKVVPGIRLTSPADDQKRVATPYEAFQSGADFIVVGREILMAEDPRRKFFEILKDAGFLDFAG